MVEGVQHIFEEKNTFQKEGLMVEMAVEVAMF
jgi:hypothetical protein